MYIPSEPKRFPRVSKEYDSNVFVNTYYSFMFAFVFFVMVFRIHVEP